MEHFSRGKRHLNGKQFTEHDTTLLGRILGLGAEHAVSDVKARHLMAYEIHAPGIDFQDFEMLLEEHGFPAPASRYGNNYQRTYLFAADRGCFQLYVIRG
jgi:hypothetical protein